MLHENLFRGLDHARKIIEDRRIDFELQEMAEAVSVNLKTAVGHGKIGLSYDKADKKRSKALTCWVNFFLDYNPLLSATYPI